MLDKINNSVYSASRGKLLLMPKSRVVDQHERVVRLSRLAMLIECEGSITVGMCPPTKTRNRPALYATVDITNTSSVIIDEAKDTLSLEDIKLTARPPCRNTGAGRKLRYNVNIHGFDRVKKTLATIMPYLRSKKRQAELVMEFVESRIAAHKHSAYSDREWQIVYEVRKLNGRMPGQRAIDKALAYLASPECDQRSRTTDCFKRYVSMCADLRKALEDSVAA